MSQPAQTGLRRFVRSRRLNAVLAWLFAGFLVAVAIGSVVTGGSLVWGGFAAAVAVLVVVPAVSFREPSAMLPWEVVALASLPLVSRVLVSGQTIGGFAFTGRLSTYLAVAAVALIVAVELDVFTPVRMNRTFAVFFVVIATMAAAGVWAVVQWLSDLYLGTQLLLNGRPDPVIEEAMMWDFVAATVAGLFAGLLFEYYFRRRSGSKERLPTDLADVGESSDAAAGSNAPDASGRVGRDGGETR
ncbi:hypothetical protein KU306_15175 [Haloferax larsenii]|uniref:Uncharacterized protein n=1 Tax=Haloferax larsenii TaxID=302484 RepID=A0ABY5RDG8_HALLR|nr:hypothetical protein [Haloferax larsenii]UVE50224.1 hypothetical protein KU306_15175 [Haloferax larsenii]